MKVRIQAVVDGSNKPVYDFGGSTITIGRDAGCDLPMPGTANVSGRHAQIALAPDGASLIDLESTNGTFLNDRRIEGRKKLRQGDYFRLGQTGPCFQIVELDLTGAALSPAVMGTTRERGAGSPAMPDRAPEYVAPAPRPLVAKPRPAPEVQQPVALAQPVPAAASGQTRLMVVELQKKNRTLIIAVGSAVAALLLIGGVTGLYLLWKQSDLSSKTANLDDTTKKQQEKMEGLDQSVGKVASNVEKITKNEEDTIYDRYAESVYLVQIIVEKLKDGRVSVIKGTAFAIDKNGTLATNGHVTNPAIQALKARREVSVIAHGGKKIYPVTAASTHPQYNGARSPDVGILTIALPAGEQLPVAVELASEDDLRKLRPGVQLCYIGFPSWSEYNTLNKIEPHLYKGGLSRLVTFNEESGDFSNQYLLQHDMQTTRGSSGSPIFNRSGKVVAVHNSGNMVDLIDAQGQKKTVSDGWKAGVRIDLLKQLIK